MLRVVVVCKNQGIFATVLFDCQSHHYLSLKGINLKAQIEKRKKKVTFTGHSHGDARSLR